MDDDETLVLCLSFACAIVALAFWYLPLVRISRLICPWAIRFPLLVTPLVCATGLLLILQQHADPQVTASGGYQALFLFAGIGGFGAAEVMLPLLGLSLREDAISRRNEGAGFVWCSALLATTAVYAASNIGTGPTIYTTLGPAALGTGMLLTAWIIHRLLSPAWEDVAVGRDAAAAVRLSALVLATAIVLLPVVAGNWVSTSATVHDGVRQAPALFGCVVVAAAGDRVLRPTGAWPRPPVIWAGLWPGFALVTLAAAEAWWRR